jgi:hypothetical protein
MRESQRPDPGRTSRIILGLETFFCFFGDPGSVLETVWIRKKHPGSATLPPTIPETMFLCTFNLFSQLSSVHVVFSLVLRICREEGCGQKNTWIDEVDEFGAGLRVHTECAVGHKMTWESSEFYNKVQFSQRVWVCKYLISGFYWWRQVTVLLIIHYIFGFHFVSSSYPSEPSILWICTLSFCSIILVFMLKKILVTVYLEFYVTVSQQW